MLVVIFLFLIINFLLVEFVDSSHTTHSTHAVKSYKSRKYLNETILGKSRVAVDSFIDAHKITSLLKFVKKSRDHFQDYGNYYKMVSMDSLFSPVFSGNVYYSRNCTFGIGCMEMADQAMNIILSTPNKFIDDELFAEVENFITIRNKILEYVSDVFNTTAHLVKNSGSFHFFPKNGTKTVSLINGTRYISPPHVDITGFKGYGRPLYLDRSLPHNYYKKFTAILYLEDLPKGSGGQLTFIDLPNRFKLPEVAATVHTDKEGILHVDGGAFADPDAVFTSVQPAKGKLVVFSSVNDVHSVMSYTGSIDRYAFTLHMTDIRGNHEQLHEIVPKIELEEAKHATSNTND